MLFEALSATVASRPSVLAIVDDRGQYTFAQLAAMAAGMSRCIAASTNQPRVGLLLPAGAGFVSSFYGALLAGKAVCRSIIC